MNCPSVPDSLSLLVWFQIIQDAYQLSKVKWLTIYLKIKSLKNIFEFCFKT